MFTMEDERKNQEYQEQLIKLYEKLNGKDKGRAICDTLGRYIEEDPNLIDEYTEEEEAYLAIVEGRCKVGKLRDEIVTAMHELGIEGTPYKGMEERIEKNKKRESKAQKREYKVKEFLGMNGNNSNMLPEAKDTVKPKDKSSMEAIRERMQEIQLSDKDIPLRHDRVKEKEDDIEK